MSIFRTLSVVLPALVGVLAPFAAPAPVAAQRYPFFVQPISVDELKPMSEELKLSPSQMEAILSFHEAYGQSFNDLQEGELRELVDRGLEMSRNVNFMGGRRNMRLEIPPRKEIEAVIRSARRVWDAFERIDNRFYGEVQSVLDEGQFTALERIQFRRRVDAYRQIHMRAVQEFNRGVRANLEDMIRRLDLSRLETESVGEVMLGYEKEMVGLCRKLESEILDVVDFVLDEIDRMGLRDMEMMEMVAMFSDPQRQEELKVLFNAQSKPLQESAARMSRLNWKTYLRLRPLIPAEKVTDLQERYFRQVFRGTGNPVFDARAFIKRVLDLPSISAAQRIQITPILEKLNRDFSALEPKIAKAYEDKRAYRTADQMEDSDLVEAQNDIDELATRARDLGENAEESTRRLLSESQLEMIDSEETESSPRSRWSRGGGRGGSGGGRSSGRWGRSSDFPLPSMTLDQATQFAMWVGMSADNLPEVESLHQGYLADYEAMADQYGEDLEAGYEAAQAEEGSSWMKRRRVRNQTTSTYRDKLSEREDRFFDDFSASMPAMADAELVGSIRRAHERARGRMTQRQGDWVLRQRPEAFIDVAALVLASDPTELSMEQRAEIVAALAIYEEQVQADVELLGEQMEKLQSVQQRLWTRGDGDEYDASMRSKMEQLRQKRRDELSRTALRLTELNRESIQGLLGSLSEDRGWPLREQYEREAYPDVFRDRDSLDEIFGQILSMDSVTPSERQQIESLILDHRSRYRELTDDMLDMAKVASLKGRSWPPDGDQMNDYMKMEQLKYRRGELNDLTRTRLVLMLGEDRTLAIDGLGPELEEDDD